MGTEGLREVGDRELVDAIKQADHDALEEAMRRYRDAVEAFARRLVRDPARAEEIAQDVFLRLWGRADRFDASRGSLRSFLLAITHGRAIDVARSDTSRQAREERDAARVTPMTVDVQQQVEQRSVSEAVRRALLALPEEERAAVGAAYLEGRTYREVAVLLGQPEGTTKSRIRRGLRRLREELAAQDLLDR